LESAVITTGLPRQAIRVPADLVDTHWNNSSPTNLETGRLMQRVVRDAGALSAIIAVIDGTLHIGLDDEHLNRLASDPNADKIASNDLAHALATNATAGTTVSATLIACAAIHSKIQNPESKIKCFATGGIGGVHRNWTAVPDISADLRALASTPMCVVCAGAKSVLDVPATLEALHMLAIPVIGWRTNTFPQFHSRGDDQLTLSQRADSASTVARICRTHWNELHQPSAVLLANPPPATFALELDEVSAAAQRAEAEAVSRGIAGPARTPFLLNEMSRLTDGRTLHANIALLAANARLAAEVAVSMARDQ
jgi:pseudouridine-5'-phosphate glycosidase